MRQKMHDRKQLQLKQEEQIPKKGTTYIANRNTRDKRKHKIETFVTK